MDTIRCKQCVLPASTPNITFDQNGKCNYCESYEPYQYKGEGLLMNREIDKICDQNKEFEAMVMISGGRDSSFVALKAAKYYNLRVLDVNYDNIFTHPTAKANIENIKAKLGIPVVSVTDQYKLHYSSFRNIVQSWFRKPSLALVPLVCIGCKLSWISIYRVARRHGIDCILCGQNPYEVISFKRELIGLSKDQKFKSGQYAYIVSAKKIVNNIRYFKPRTLATMVLAYLFGAPMAIGSKIFMNKVNWIALFEYIPWNEEQILQRIKSELSWDYPHELKSTWRFDCRVKHLADFLYLANLGLTDKDDFYSKLVREKQFTREEVLKRLEIESKVHHGEIKKVLELSGLANLDAFDEYVAALERKNEIKPAIQ